MTRNREPSFEVSTSGRGDGTIEAIYIRLSDHKIAKTEELVQDILFADIDRNGVVVGFEILAPIRISKLTSKVRSDIRQPFKAFVTKSIPKDFLVRTP